MSEKNSHGGARPNAGVKIDPLVGKRLKVATTLSPKHLELIKKEGKPMSHIIGEGLDLYFGISSKNKRDNEINF